MSTHDKGTTMSDQAIPTSVHTTSRESAPEHLPTTMGASCCRFKSCGLTPVYLARENGELVYLRNSNDERYMLDDRTLPLHEQIEAGAFWSVKNTEVSDETVRCDAYVSTYADETDNLSDEADKREVADAYVSAVGVVRARTYRFESVERYFNEAWGAQFYRFTYVAD